MIDMNKIREYQDNLKQEEEKKLKDFRDFIEPILPIAILFCNSQGQDAADKNNLNLIFEGTASQKYQALDKTLQGFEFVGYLAEFVGNINGTEVNDVVIITNAKEIGFDGIRIMHYFDEMFYIETVEQALTLDKLGFYLEEKSYLEQYADQLKDKAWEIYDYFRDELSEKIFKPEKMNKEIDKAYDFANSDDALSNALVKLIENLKHN
jgi:hypothetical protein